MIEDKKIKREPHPQIIIRVLEELSKRGESRQTKLAWASNLSYDALLRCMGLLKKKGMVTISSSESGHNIVRITKKGIDALAELSKWYKQ